MKAVERRISRLEDQFRPQISEPNLVIITQVGKRLALDNDACIQVLRDEGFIRGTGFVPVDLLHIPDGLNAAELKKYLLEHGDKIVGPHDPS